MTDTSEGGLQLVTVTARITIDGTIYAANTTLSAEDYDADPMVAHFAHHSVRYQLAEEVRLMDPGYDFVDLTQRPDIDIRVTRFTMNLTDTEENDQ